MSTKRARELPSRLVSLRRRFEDWRRTRKVRSRIPKPLWDSAVKLAGVYGLNRTAKALRINYYALKKRGERQAVTGFGNAAKGNAANGEAARFLELMAPEPASAMRLGVSVSAGTCECMLELEHADGAKMRVRLSGMVAPDLVALSRSFWRAES